MSDYIEPQTDAFLDVTVSDSLGVVTDATVVASVWSPKGTQVATDVSMAHQGAGKYRLAISRSWSELAGIPVEGEFLARVKATRGGTERRRKFRYVVKFDDED